MPTRIMTLVTLTPAQSRSNYIPTGEFFTAHDGERYPRNIEVQYMHPAKKSRADGYMVTSHEGEVLGYVSLGPDGRGHETWCFRRVRAAYGHSGRDDGGYSAADRGSRANSLPGQRVPRRVENARRLSARG